MANKELKNMTRFVDTVKEKKDEKEIANMQRCLLDNLSEELKADAEATTPVTPSTPAKPEEEPSVQVI